MARLPRLCLALVLLAGCRGGGDDAGDELAESGTDGSGESSSDSSSSDSSGDSELTGTDSSAGTDGSGSTDGSGDSDTGDATGTSDSGDSTETGDTGDGTDTGDATDTGIDEGFGAITGPCPLLGGALALPEPALLSTHLDFRGDPFDDPEDLPFLTPGGQIIVTTPNEGGSSTISEAFAFEVLARCEGAELLATEIEIMYLDDMGKKTDILVDFEGQQIGVSVTRAVGFPPEDPYPEAQAAGLIQAKLEDVLASTANVAPAHEWDKQILVVMAYADMHAELIATAWAALDPAIQADTIVYLVTTDGENTPIYFE